MAKGVPAVFMWGKRKAVARLEVATQLGGLGQGRRKKPAFICPANGSLTV
jgi:hypothetical protein